MTQKKFNFINWIGLTIISASIIYLFVLYLVMFCAEPTFFAGRWYAGLGGYYIAKIVICITVFTTFLAGIISLIRYTMHKISGRRPEKEKVFAGIIVVCVIVNLIIAIVFWALQGQVFDGRLTNAESTVYRIIDLGATLAAFGGLWMLVVYRPRYDRIKELKKLHNRI